MLYCDNPQQKITITASTIRDSKSTPGVGGVVYLKNAKDFQILNTDISLFSSPV